MVFLEDHRCRRGCLGEGFDLGWITPQNGGEEKESNKRRKKGKQKSDTLLIFLQQNCRNGQRDGDWCQISPGVLPNGGPCIPVAQTGEDLSPPNSLVRRVAPPPPSGPGTWVVSPLSPTMMRPYLSSPRSRHSSAVGIGPSRARMSAWCPPLGGSPGQGRGRKGNDGDGVGGKG